jgi:8-oxo-dGTP diphosphatase
MAYTYEYPRPAVTVDAVVLALDEGDLKVLLIKRGVAPFAGKWALPGGFVRMEETLEAAVRRELKEEAGLADIYLEQLYTFGEPGRDPRGRTVSVAYYGLVKRAEHRPSAATDAADAGWFAVAELPGLAFDHAKIVAAAVKRLKGKVRYQPIGFELLPRKFTLSELQHLYEVVLERALDKRNFRKKILAMGLLVDTGEMEKEVAHRAARLFAFDQKKYAALERRGFNFEV